MEEMKLTMISRVSHFDDIIIEVITDDVDTYLKELQEQDCVDVDDLHYEKVNVKIYNNKKKINK
mgnify:CR=1 FL=1